MKVSISKGNSKMGVIPSVSLPPITTCKHCESCAKKCYAAKLCRLYTSVRKAYENNLKCLKENRAEYFEQVKSYARMTTFFRWHVSGDIIDLDYLDRMVKVARECKNTAFLVFTKNYEDVNEYFEHRRKPRNLQIIFSLPFDGAEIDNPNNLPTASVILKGQEPKPSIKCAVAIVQNALVEV